MDQTGQRHAEPAKKTAGRHTLYHNHHAADEENGLPVDACGGGGAASLNPEGGQEHAAEAERLHDGTGGVHTKAKYDDQRQKAAGKRHDMAGKFFCYDKCKHGQKDHSGDDWSKHRKPLFQKLHGWYGL